jgi:signal transduction histidine kinase
MRWRVFVWFGIVIAVTMMAGRWIVASGAAKWWAIVAVFSLLWFASGMLAWRLTRPLVAVIDAARAIGDGKLETRIDARRHGGELEVLAGAINDMASRIERQIADQRELLAAVSHELRTPMGHMRILIETARDRGADPKIVGELDAEVARLDDLVGRLLASSRLDFDQLDRRAIDVGALAADVATAQGDVAPDRIAADGDVTATADPTLLRRAVANLIDNAKLHGGGAVGVRVERRGDEVAVEVDDAGPGVPAERRADAFRPFVPSSGGGLGLGLALVHRIARAHGGRAWIDDRPGGGARVGFAIPVDASRSGEAAARTESERA